MTAARPGPAEPPTGSGAGPGPGPDGGVLTVTARPPAASERAPGGGAGGDRGGAGVEPGLGLTSPFVRGRTASRPRRTGPSAPPLPPPRGSGASSQLPRGGGFTPKSLPVSFIEKINRLLPRPRGSGRAPCWVPSGDGGVCVCVSPLVSPPVLGGGGGGSSVAAGSPRRRRGRSAVSSGWPRPARGRGTGQSHPVPSALGDQSWWVSPRPVPQRRRRRLVAEPPAAPHLLAGLQELLEGHQPVTVPVHLLQRDRGWGGMTQRGCPQGWGTPWTTPLHHHPGKSHQDGGHWPCGHQPGDPLPTAVPPRGHLTHNYLPPPTPACPAPSSPPWPPTPRPPGEH